MVHYTGNVLNTLFRVVGSSKLSRVLISDQLLILAWTCLSPFCKLRVAINKEETIMEVELKEKGIKYALK